MADQVRAPDEVRRGSGLSIGLARANQAPEVLAILREAAAWLEQGGMPMWREEELDPTTVATDVQAGRYALALSEALPVGTLRFTLEDEQFWPDAVAGEAAYVHRLAVRRSRAGGAVSTALLDWATARTASLGRRFLRLDCDATRPRLRAFYESQGFIFHSERTVGPYFVARYQKTTGV
jgi:GNAT superfamily N-acetyltransferase